MQEGKELSEEALQIAEERYIQQNAESQRIARRDKQAFCFIDYDKAFDCLDHNKPWRILKEMGIPEHLTYLLRNLYVGQEGTVRILHETSEWFKIGKGISQS